MDRRQFLMRGVKNVTETVVEVAEQRIKKQVSWIRPPFAVPEFEFVLQCDRCGECIAACPYQVIFPLPMKKGAQVAATPAMDILNKACHLCEQWPCVNACTPHALMIPDTDSESGDVPHELPLPKMAIAFVNTTHCLPYQGPECGACAASCPIPQTLCWDKEQPHIVAETCVGCGLCREACIANPKAIEIRLMES